jgi:hypothetical protein
MPRSVTEGIVDLRSLMDGSNKKRLVRYAKISNRIFVFHFIGCAATAFELFKFLTLAAFIKLKFQSSPFLDLESDKVEWNSSGFLFK